MWQSENHLGFRGVNPPRRAGKMDELVKCLPEEHEDLSPIPRIHVKNTGAVTQACDLSTEEVEAGRSLGLK